MDTAARREAAGGPPPAEAAPKAAGEAPTAADPAATAAEAWGVGEWRPSSFRRHPKLARQLFSSVWLAYLAAPVSSLVRDHSSGAQLALGLAVTAVFVAAYELALASDAWPARQLQVAVPALLIMAAVMVTTSLAFGESWVLLAVYLSVAAVASLPDRLAAPAAAASCLLALGL